MTFPVPQAFDSDPRHRIRSRLSTPAVYLAIAAATLSPLLWVAIPPLADYPDHLARVAVLTNRDAHAAIASNYTVHWRLVPNLAIDLAAPALARILPLEIAGRVFVALAMLLLVAGTAALHRALHGRAGLWPLASVLFLYNDLLALGFLAFLFTLGLALLGFGLWVASEAWLMAARIAVFAVIAALLLVLHLFGFGVFALLVVAYEAGRAVAEPWRRANLLRRAASLLQFVPAGLLWLAALSNMGVLHTAEGGVQRKLTVWFMAPLMSAPPAPLDFAVLYLAVAFPVFAFATRTLVLAPAMRLPLAVLAAAGVLMPESLSGATEADLRLPVALCFVVIGATRLDPTRAPRALAVFTCLGGALFALRVAGVTLGWRALDRQFAEFRHAIAALPQGARMTTVLSEWPDDAYTIAAAPGLLNRSQTDFWHLDTLAVIDRGAFVTDLFTTDTPVEPGARNAGLARTYWRPLTPQELVARAGPASGDPAALRVAQDGRVPCCYDWPQVYDFVLWIDYGRVPAPLPALLEPWASGSYFHIYRVVKPSRPSPP